MSLPRLFARYYTDEMLAEDRNRMAPTFDMSGDDSIPCRWWHPDMGPFCARCGSGRIDLHHGEWDFRTRTPRLWTARQRYELGLYVEPEWWHQAAGMT